jgi:hypothetical protein
MRARANGGAMRGEHRDCRGRSKVRLGSEACGPTSAAALDAALEAADLADDTADGPHRRGRLPPRRRYRRCARATS